MKESAFYQLLDTWEKDLIDGKTPTELVAGFFPTVNELKSYNIEQKMEKFIEIITFYASDPFGNNIAEQEKKQYTETVKYCNKILYNLELSS